MRRIVRNALTPRVTHFLCSKQRELNSGGDPTVVWNRARRTKAMRAVENVLQAMSRGRQRCMFCEDSRGTDIDHFWPKVPFPERTFVWDNLLWVCAGCNRKKGTRFLLDDDGKPLLIDPTADDPWDHLYFDADTGMIVACVHPDTGMNDPKGEHTTDPRVLPLNIEAITDSRRRTYRCLCRAVRRYLDVAARSASSDQAEAELLDEIRDHDDFGLASWYFLRDGGKYPPFSDLQLRHPTVWLKARKAVVG